MMQALDYYTDIQRRYRNVPTIQTLDYYYTDTQILCRRVGEGAGSTIQAPDYYTDIQRQYRNMTTIQTLDHYTDTQILCRRVGERASRREMNRSLTKLNS